MGEDASMRPTGRSVPSRFAVRFVSVNRIKQLEPTLPIIRLRRQDSPYCRIDLAKLAINLSCRLGIFARHGYRLAVWLLFESKQKN